MPLAAVRFARFQKHQKEWFPGSLRPLPLYCNHPLEAFLTQNGALRGGNGFAQRIQPTQGIINMQQAHSFAPFSTVPKLQTLTNKTAAIIAAFASAQIHAMYLRLPPARRSSERRL